MKEIREREQKKRNRDNSRKKRYKKSCVGLCITCQPTGDWRIFSDFFQKNFVNVWNFLFALDKLENFNHGLDTLVANVCFKEFDCRI